MVLRPYTYMTSVVKKQTLGFPALFVKLSYYPTIILYYIVASIVINSAVV